MDETAEAQAAAEEISSIIAGMAMVSLSTSPLLSEGATVQMLVGGHRILYFGTGLVLQNPDEP
jgi:hypothetical protein